MRTNDAFPGYVQVDVSGSVSVNSIDTQDQAAGGNDGGNVTVRGGSVTVGDVDTRALRTASGDRLSGDVLLEARQATGDNTLGNTINVTGVVNTDSTIGHDGDVTMSGVVVTLEAGFAAVTGDGPVSIHAGIVQYGRTPGDLFIDDSGGYSAAHDVFWTAAGAEYYASYPRPYYDAEGVDPNVVLSWTPGDMATSHDVYFGTSFEDVNDAVDPNVDPGRGRQDSNSYAPEGLLEFGVTYYWRIDEVVGNDACKGSVRHFTVDDGKAGHPNPADGASHVPVEMGLSWTPGALATSHDVYFGTDFNDVNDANSSWAVGTSVYKGGQEANSFDPGSLRLNSTYYWRIDEVGATTFVKGDVWSSKTALARIVGHSIVYGAPDTFCGWPANNGVWLWGNEILVGFVYGPYVEKGGHNIGSPSYTGLGRSLDGGQTWTFEDPPDFVGDGGMPVPSPGGINFAHPDFALRTVSYTSEGQFFFSYDRGYSWQGPYTCGDLMSHPELSGLENSSRTDYVVNGSDDCLIGMSARGCGPTDRAFMARTTDGGSTFNFVSWVNTEPCTTRGVMPSTVRISESKLVTTLRRKYPGEWIDAFVSYDNGNSWAFLSKVTDTYTWNGNPPALVQLPGGRVCCAYGNRLDRRIEARISDDEGATWSDEIILRDDYQPDSYNDPDLGYCRMVVRPDGKLVTMYYWATPEHPTHHIGATIWDPGGTIDPGLALNPSPQDQAEDVGLYAASHRVYLGTDFADVNDANTSSAEYMGSQSLEVDSLDPPGLLELATTYYWRIDEANGPDLWKGRVWSFTTIDHVVLDDMESYDNDGNYIFHTWKDGCGDVNGMNGNGTGSCIDLATDPVHGGAQAMSYVYSNSGAGGSEPYSEVSLAFAGARNWNQLGLKALSLWFYGNPGNDANEMERMYVALADASGHEAAVGYGDNGEDGNDVKVEQWHEWNVPLSYFTDVNLAAVKTLHICFGDRDYPIGGGSGVVHFDDIRLYVPRCLQPISAADLTEDCLVGFADLGVMADEWLTAGVMADLVDDNNVDFRDFTLLADDWLKEFTWP
jgi:hypothetical protein